MKTVLPGIYRRLHGYFGPQHWWPAETPFEVMVGAILTQNTSWQNVEKAISNLKKKKLLSLRALHALPLAKLAQLIRPAGYYNVKAARLRAFTDFLFSAYKGSLSRMRCRKTAILRRELLSVKGIGEETADSILLYALEKPVFVVDAYTKRVLLRHGLIRKDAGYAETQALFMSGLKKNTRLFNEYHALLVRLAKEFCRKRLPRCGLCPLRDIPR